MPKKNSITEEELHAEYQRLMMESLERPEIDPSAVTTEEIAQSTGLSYSHCIKVAKQMVLGGKWEKVQKMRNGRLSPAYRPTNKKKSK